MKKYWVTLTLTYEVQVVARDEDEARNEAEAKLDRADTDECELQHVEVSECY